MFPFQAKLVPIPEGYKPKEWEYYKNPISRCAHNAYIADNVSFCLAKQTDQADGEILETLRRSARVRDEHAWSLGSSQGKPTILYFMICPQVFLPSISLYKVNRCLARYSPRATTTNRALNKPAWPGPN